MGSFNADPQSRVESDNTYAGHSSAALVIVNPADEQLAGVALHLLDAAGMTVAADGSVFVARSFGQAVAGGLTVLSSRHAHRKGEAMGILGDHFERIRASLLSKAAET